MTDITIKLKDFQGKGPEFKKLIREFGIAHKDQFGYIIEDDKNKFVVKTAREKFHTVVLDMEDSQTFRFVIANDNGKNPDFIYPQDITHVQSLYE